MSVVCLALCSALQVQSSALQTLQSSKHICTGFYMKPQEVRVWGVILLYPFHRKKRRCREVKCPAQDPSAGGGGTPGHAVGSAWLQNQSFFSQVQGWLWGCHLSEAVCAVEKSEWFKELKKRRGRSQLAGSVGRECDS